MKLFERHIRTGNEKLNYLLYAPDDFKPNLPMITFLHGAGERGVHTENLYRHGIPKLIKEGLEIPVFILILYLKIPDIMMLFIKRMLKPI